MLTFAPEGRGYRGSYTIAADIRRGDEVVRHVEAHEMVRVSALKETTRNDESVIDQQFIRLAPGRYAVTISLRDDGSARSVAQQSPIDVPRLDAGTLSSAILTYRSSARTALDTVPDLIANPRATVVFGRDSNAIAYIEGYGLGDNRHVEVSVADDKAIVVWTDTVTLDPSGTLVAGTLRIPLTRVGVGRLTLRARRLEERRDADTLATPLLVSLGEEMAIASFVEMLSYLRFFAAPERLQALRDASSQERARAWSTFWRETYPLPSTPEHEGLREYFDRIQNANQRFREPGTAGWLTDREGCSSHWASRNKSPNAVSPPSVSAR